ncbi:hypothetical protein BTUL_0188g00110 [Botrytis tulipae]|uniref:Uncharacterized protein n=1 Tax=Botrytis tulipae TaxID=87230 RepID=A0A4Z1EDQ7_9HELO|nr:hypothetical protein BTUL_0188g00110 [Botrytis tulipae]
MNLIWGKYPVSSIQNPEARSQIRPASLNFDEGNYGCRKLWVSRTMDQGMNFEEWVVEIVSQNSRAPVDIPQIKAVRHYGRSKVLPFGRDIYE